MKNNRIISYSSLSLLLLTGCNLVTNSSSVNTSNNAISNSTISSNVTSSSSTSSSDNEQIELKDKNINIYLIGGQSNAVGYGLDTGNVLANSDDRFISGFDNVLYYGVQERWGGPSTNEGFTPVKIGQGVDYNRSGAEIGIANAIADNGEMNAIIKCAWGATHLYPDSMFDISLNQGTWTSPSYIIDNNVDKSKNKLIGRMYSFFEETVLNGITILKEQGYNPIIKGMWWMQGEAEMFTSEMSSKYENLLKYLINDVRTSISNITGSDYSEMPFVFGLPSWNIKYKDGVPAYEKAVRNAMINVANDSNIINATYVDCSSLIQHDTWHFDAASQKYLGESFIEKLEMLDEGDNSLFYENISINKDINLLLDKEGLEYKANIINYDLDNNYEYGMIFVPTKDLKDNNISKDYINALNALNIKYVDVECEVKQEIIDDTYRNVYIKNSVEGITYKDLNTKYTAIAYIKDGNKYLYSANNVDGSFTYLASRALYEQNENLDLIQKYVDAGVNSVLNIPEEDKFNSSNLKLEVEDEIILDYSKKNSEFNLNLVQNPNMGYYVKYASLNEEIVTVDEYGNLVANSLGETEVVIQCGGKTKNVKVVVENGSENGVTFDGIINENEYLGEVITCSNANVTLDTRGMLVGNKIYLSFKFTHGNWAPYSNTWYENDNIEFVVNGGKSNTIVFYNGEPTFSNNIIQGEAKTEEVNGKLVTSVEICLLGQEDLNTLTIAMNGKAIGWLGTFWHYDNWYTRNLYITSSGVSEINHLANGVTLDGIFDDSVYTESVKTNSLNFKANGADINMMGTLLNDGVLYGITINHTKDPNQSLGGDGSWYTFMNAELRFANNISKQFIATCKNQYISNGMLSYCKSISSSNGYTSYFEIFIPYTSIGVNSNITSIDFTVNGWVQTGWCWFFNKTDWNATHTLTKDGITAK